MRGYDDDPVGFTQSVAWIRALRSKTGLLRAASRLLAAGLVAYLVVRLWQLWGRHPIDFHTADAGGLALGVVAAAAAVTAFGLVWTVILRRLGVVARPSWVGVWFKSQLGKYLPGSVWQYAGRVTLGRSRGVPVQAGLASIAVEVVASIIAAGVIAALALPLAFAFAAWAALALLCGAAYVVRGGIAAAAERLAAPALARVDRATVAAGLRSVPLAAGLYIVAWALYGTAFWLTAHSLFAVPASDLLHYVGVFAIAWTVGFVVVFAPGGIGVREAVLVALLSGRLGEAHAIALAAASRLVLSAIDLGGGAVALLLPLLHRPRRKPVGAAE
jgi:glycosyltransferase 2 family protein